MPGISDRDPLLCLASASPRRRELLWQIGVAHLVVPAAIEESQRPSESAADYVRRLSVEKAQRVWDTPALRQGLPVLAADTSVVLDGAVLGKPADRADAARMLRALSAREHLVLSAVALATAAGVACRLCSTTVRFRAIDAAEIERYAATSEPLDKAGAYAIQGFAAVFVESIRGSYSGVMGLPLFETSQLLDLAGIARWQGAPN